LQKFCKKRVDIVAEGKSQKRKRGFLLLRIAVVVVGICLAAIWARSEGVWPHLKDAFARMHLWVFACTTVVFSLCQFVVMLRWWLLLRTQGIYISYWAVVRLCLTGWFFNNLLPSSVGGDVIRLWYATKHTDKKFEAALSVPVDRVIGLISTLAIAFFFYTVFLRAEGQTIDFERREGLLKLLRRYGWLLGVAAGLCAAVIAGLLAHSRGRALLGSLWRGARTHGARAITKLANAVRLYRTKPLAILQAFGLTVFLQITNITGFWLLGRDLGIAASIKYYYVFFTLVWVVGAIPVSIGGAVVVEGMLCWLFVNVAGAQAGPALALALCQRAVWMITSVPGAVIHLVGGHLPKHFSVDGENCVE